MAEEGRMGDCISVFELVHPHGVDLDGRSSAQGHIRMRSEATRRERGENDPISNTRGWLVQGKRGDGPEGG